MAKTMVRIGRRPSRTTPRPTSSGSWTCADDLGVFPHEATNSEVLPVGDLLIVSTSNGQNEGHTRVPSPRAPKPDCGEQALGRGGLARRRPGEHVLHGQWSSPAAADVHGRIQVLFGGGDGWLRSYDAAIWPRGLAF